MLFVWLGPLFTYGASLFPNRYRDETSFEGWGRKKKGFEKRRKKKVLCSLPPLRNKSHKYKVGARLAQVPGEVATGHTTWTTTLCSAVFTCNYYALLLAPYFTRSLGLRCININMASSDGPSGFIRQRYGSGRWASEWTGRPANHTRLRTCVVPSLHCL